MTGRPGRSALLVVDLQVGVVRDAHDAPGVLARTESLIGRARAAGVPVVYVSHEEDAYPRGSADWQLAPPLEPRADEIRVLKSYRDAFAGTDLAGTLRRLGATRVLVAGCQSDYCVQTTAQRAAAEGFDVVLVGDCHTTWDSEYAGVAISAEQVVAHTNQYFSGLRYPGQRCSVEPSGTVDLG